MGTPTVTELRALAERRHRDPVAVREAAAAAVREVPRDRLEHAVALWVLGLAVHETGRPVEAARRYRAALRLAARHGHDAELAAARASLAMSLLAVGDTDGAHREMQRARATTARADAASVEALWGVLLQRTGHLPEALAVFEEVLPRLRQEGDDAGAARLLLNRGTLLAYRGDIRRAVDDLAEAERLADRRGLSLLTAMAAHNLGFTIGRSGDVPRALASFDRARTAYRTVGDPPRQVAVLEADRSEMLLQAGLATDARAGAERALAALGTSDVVDRAHQTEVQLLLAQSLLAEGRAADAGRAAEDAARAFRKARRPAWSAMADYVAAQARVAEVEEDRQASPELLSRTRRTARTLDRLGWSTEATHVRTLLGRVALSLGRPDVVRAELERGTRPGRGATVDARTTAWHATALYRLARGDRTGAKHALRQGLTLVDRYRAGAVATELRAAAGARATELGRLGLRLALQDGRPAEVLRWAERWRAGSLRLPPVVPPADAELADLAAALVEARAAMRDSALGGRPDPTVARRVARIERALRHRSLQVAGPSSVAVAVTGFDLPALRAGLGPATLVEYVALERRLWAVTVRHDGQQLHDLGPLEPVLAELRFLLSALRRQNAAATRGPGVVAAAPPVAPSPAADRLDAALLRPLALDPASPLVVVPTGGLHGLPWAALPSAFLRPVTVAPSADLWLRRGRPHSRPDAAAVALVAGPDLPGAAAEVHRLADVYRDARVLTGASATVDATLDAFARHDLVHVAAHGQFRADSPLFSSLQLADGHLTVYDLERLHGTTPATVVLPACDAARADVRLGDEVIGTTTALLVRGVRAVVAPLVPVPDDLTADLMVALHERLRAGLPPSEALAAAADSCSPDSLSAWSSFVCVGTAGS